MDEDDAVSASVYEGDGEDEGLIGLVFGNAPLCVFEGDITSGICMTPEQARYLAGALLESAANVEHRHL